MISLWVIRHHPGWRICHPIDVLFLLVLILIFGRLSRRLSPLYQGVVQFDVRGPPASSWLAYGLHLDRRGSLLPLLWLWLQVVVLVVLHRIVIVTPQVLQGLLRDLVAANL